MKKYRYHFRRTDINLNDAFKALRKAGYYAKQCSVERKPDNTTKHVMFTEDSYKRKINGEDFFLDWEGNGYEICYILSQHNIKTYWQGSDAITIKVIQ